MVLEISIIGVGLIGGSLGRALKQAYHEKIHITGVGRNYRKLLLAKKLNAVDEITIDLEEGVKNKKVVFICTPPMCVIPIFKNIHPHLHENTLVSDVSSVKSYIMNNIRKLLINDDKKVIFIGSHPLAGSEKSGVKYSSPDLFKDAAVILTLPKYGKGKDKRFSSAKELLEELWKKTGAKVTYLTPEEHDYIIGLTSHLPHIISATLCEYAYHEFVKGKKNLPQLLAPSFKELTRITDSLPSLWAEILYTNRDAIKRIIDKYSQGLKKLYNGLSSVKKLEYFFTAARSGRRKLLTAQRKKRT
jgi:prephenate dehydrogenase